MPLLLALFQQFSLVSPLANAVAIPLVSLLVTPLALLGNLPGMDWALQLAHAVLVPLIDLLAWLASWPGALWQQHAPPGWAVPLALLGVFWLLLPQGFPARGLGAVWLLPLFFIPPVRPPPGALWVTVLDVGQGQAVHVQTAHHDLIIDTGPDFGGNTDAGSRILVPYLRAVGVARLDRLIVSHADRDHAGGMAGLLAAVPAMEILTSIEKSALAGRHASRRCIAGETWLWDDVRFLMLHPTLPDYARRRSTNAMSCVLKIESAYGSVLIPGDIEGVAEAELLIRQGAALASDLLVAPHHGGRRTSSPEFVAAVAAREVIFSAGYRNRFQHPWPAVESRYRTTGAGIHRTDRDGAVRIELEAQRTRVIHSGEARRRYWHVVETDR
jgi:competence protein ComEC